MARNIAKPLSRDEAMRAYALRDRLDIGRVVTLDYVKRDGSTSSSTGEVVFHNGAEGMDTMSVTLATEDKGNRTINLCRVTNVTD